MISVIILLTRLNDLLVIHEFRQNYMYAGLYAVVQYDNFLCGFYRPNCNLNNVYANAIVFWLYYILSYILFQQKSVTANWVILSFKLEQNFCRIYIFYVDALEYINKIKNFIWTFIFLKKFSCSLGIERHFMVFRNTDELEEQKFNFY